MEKNLLDMSILVPIIFFFGKLSKKPMKCNAETPEFMENKSAVAKDALVFMINCVNERWKLPIGYFLNSSINTAEKSNVVNACLRFLQHSGIISLTLLIFLCALA